MLKSTTSLIKVSKNLPPTLNSSFVKFFKLVGLDIPRHAIK